MNPTKLASVAVLIALGIGMVWLYRRGIGGVAEDAAKGAVNAVGGIAVGGVKGLGEAAGIPDTNMNACRAAIAAGDRWQASFVCPAGEFLRSLWPENLLYPDVTEKNYPEATLH